MIIANLCLFVVVATTQPIAVKAMASADVALPPMTRMVLGPMFLAEYASVLALTLAFLRFKKDVIHPDWQETTLFGILIFFLGQYLIAVTLPFIGGPVPLT